MSKHGDSKWHPHLALVSFSLYSSLIHCLFHKWSEAIRAPSRGVCVCDDKCKLYSSPKGDNWSLQRDYCPIKRNWRRSRMAAE